MKQMVIGIASRQAIRARALSIARRPSATTQRTEDLVHLHALAGRGIVR